MIDKIELQRVRTYRPVNILGNTVKAVREHHGNQTNVIMSRFDGFTGSLLPQVRLDDFSQLAYEFVDPGITVIPPVFISAGE